MSALVVDPTAVAQAYRERLRADVADLDEPLRIVGFLGQDDGPAATYARYAAKGCESVGIEFDLRRTDAAGVEAAIGDANADPDVHGIFLYYPIGAPGADRWLRELVDPRKDVEGMHAFWSRCLYENRRWLDASRMVRAILPCTPLAILKLLGEAGLRRTGAAAPLEGVTACVINRSDIVGRPLSAMLANDGAEVISLDLDGAQVFEPAIGRHAHSVRDSDVDRAAALALSDVVITGVPSPDFELVRAEEIKDGAICVNFSQFRNFAPDVPERAASFVPRVGPMTVTMAMRNALRLYRTVQSHR
ncbi:bifunctional methylenetetrahydrofolate dehydrogenase/methenyltetrahydrofolate cyclohydrolase [Agilicoccus flavus]|uniref:bifunctional methylenetetrahydrofolate dehydrogenase/methenyltetrahydrofolate cyclohydrolase n=1 Tax=Agilicoccus flavus TaxID=2775968 RepID=UPI001CF672C6|nr:bifunctional methylenetetrahydrofolate dehydrogenase/methenyltetrahydrofolate cyclohydrolase [Agilicoccus flavus]